jgi:hypothetical protein
LEFGQIKLFGDFLSFDGFKVKFCFIWGDRRSFSGNGFLLFRQSRTGFHRRHETRRRPFFNLFHQRNQRFNLGFQVYDFYGGSKGIENPFSTIKKAAGHDGAAALKKMEELT